MHPHKIIKVGVSSHPHLQKTISQELGISEILAQVLVNRGIKTPGDAQKFLHPRLADLANPFSFHQMDHAVKIIRNAQERKDKVLVFSDYDVDGLTALALLKGALGKKGIKAEHYLPHRIKEGYGLTKEIAHFAKEKGIKLLITCDCGTNSLSQIKELRSLGIEVIITDHHESSTHELSSASSIINPKVKDSGYPYRDLAGVGVAYKLAQALGERKPEEDLDLAALGTIADVVPLVGENRIIAKFGLESLSRTRRPGLEALIKASRLKTKKINSTFVSFILGPRINSSGRMDTAETSLLLLLSNDPKEADELAGIIEGHNRQRQKVEAKILMEALSLIEQEVDFKKQKVIVLAGEDWHQGVLGIVASKLADRFYRPTILISKTDGLCKGSGRSIKNFHLFQALLECEGLLHNFGGHAHAVGLTVSRQNIGLLRDRINILADEKLVLEDLLPALEVDMELSLSDIGIPLAEELETLEPFGTANPEPSFFTRGLKLKGEPQVLSRDTLKFRVTDGIISYPAIGFGKGILKDSLLAAGSFDLVYTLKIDNWREELSVILEVKDIFFR
ncbi:MAG: single-stranded-DNA-specific exonuclease RecJ [Candidatus Omnitrophica bacterium]|nr:single-stranded-DNA-specific exonuclease RecJ [Candidatus Omnitrophota bacterium]